MASISVLSHMLTTSVPYVPTSQIVKQQQIKHVGEFAASRGLTLSTEKCEVTVSPSIPPTLSSIQVRELNFPVTNSARCLGAWWTPSLSCSKWIETNIKKARGAFFSRGSGVFHGTLNPLSSRSIIECCVFPCLLSGAEAWILNDTLIRQLESFQAELAKRILRLPRHTSNNVTRMALQWPSMRARILIIKLSFLLRVSRDNRSLSSRVFRSLATSEVESLIIVWQCRFLESPLQSNFTSSVLASPKHISITSMKKEARSLPSPIQCYFTSFPTLYSRNRSQP